MSPNDLLARIGTMQLEADSYHFKIARLESDLHEAQEDLQFMIANEEASYLVEGQEELEEELAD